MAIRAGLALPILGAGLKQFGVFSSVLSFRSTRTIDYDPIKSLQQKAINKPEKLSIYIKAAQQVLTAPMIFTSDIETTGAIPDLYGPHKINALGLVGYSQGVKEVSAEFILNPERPCSTPAITMHGLQSADLKKRKTFKQAMPKYLDVLNLYDAPPLWFHNAAFDKRVLKCELEQLHPKYLALFKSTTVYCSYQLALTIRPKFKNHNTLDQLCNYYEVNNDARKNGHGALIDSEILLQVLLRLSEDVIDKAKKAGVLDDMLAFDDKAFLKN